VVVFSQAFTASGIYIILQRRRVNPMKLANAEIHA
jgi:hypothetical protein